MTSSQYVTSSSRSVRPNRLKYVSTFLSAPHKSCNEAWVVARAGSNNNGALRIRLVDQFGSALSDTSEVFGSNLERIKLLNVNIPSATFPPLIKLEVTNKSTRSNSTAYCDGLILVFN